MLKLICGTIDILLAIILMALRGEDPTKKEEG
jgi:hypothetical protein